MCWAIESRTSSHISWSPCQCWSSTDSLSLSLSLSLSQKTQSSLNLNPSLRCFADSSAVSVPGSDGQGSNNPYFLSRIRLRGGSHTSGRVEVLQDGVWGTVCDDNWDENDAAVVCRELGFAGYIQVYREAYFGQGTGPIHVDGISCRGSETTLNNCFRKLTHDCTHAEDAGVECSKLPVSSLC